MQLAERVIAAGCIHDESIHTQNISHTALVNVIIKYYYTEVFD
jgi:hypothetical protein